MILSSRLHNRQNCKYKSWRLDGWASAGPLQRTTHMWPQECQQRTKTVPRVPAAPAAEFKCSKLSHFQPFGGPSADRIYQSRRYWAVRGVSAALRRGRARRRGSSHLTYWGHQPAPLLSDPPRIITNRSKHDCVSLCLESAEYFLKQRGWSVIDIHSIYKLKHISQFFHCRNCFSGFNWQNIRQSLSNVQCLVCSSAVLVGVSNVSIVSINGPAGANTAQWTKTGRK